MTVWQVYGVRELCGGKNEPVQSEGVAVNVSQANAWLVQNVEWLGV